MTGSAFGAEAPAFLAALVKHTAHRAEYDEHVRRPLESLLETVTHEYGPGRVMRQHRDVRFSPDKTPYRTRASMWAGTVGGVHLQLDAAGIEVGGARLAMRKHLPVSA